MNTTDLIACFMKKGRGGERVSIVGILLVVVALPIMIIVSAAMKK